MSTLLQQRFHLRLCTPLTCALTGDKAVIHRGHLGNIKQGYCSSEHALNQRVAWATAFLMQSPSIIDFETGICS